MGIWTEFDNWIKEMFYFTNGKSIVLWGYGLSGFFIQHLFSRTNRKIEYIVDDNSLNPKIPIMRSCEISDISPDTCVVIISEEYDRKSEEFLIKLGFKENISYIFARKYLYERLNTDNIWRNISYYEYLENKFGADIIEKKGIDRMKNPKKDALNYSPGMGYPLMDVLDNFNKIGISPENIINGDAARVKSELDEYNYFFMYNPFHGETFRHVIDNIEESQKRRKRRITLIYSGPYCHMEVIAHGIFKLSKQIYTDYSVRKVNIYTAE